MAELPKTPTTPNKTGKIVAISAVVVGVGIGLYFLLTANRASAQRPTRTQPTPAKKTGGIADVLSKLFGGKKDQKGKGGGGAAPKGSTPSSSTKPKPAPTKPSTEKEYPQDGENEETTSEYGISSAYSASTYGISGAYSGGAYGGGGNTGAYGVGAEYSNQTTGYISSSSDY